MQIVCISIFPEIYESFISTSLIAKAVDAGHISFMAVNPRQFCTDKHQQIDDEPYGGGAGLVMKAQPIIDAIQTSVDSFAGQRVAIVMVKPSHDYFVQQSAHTLADMYDAIIFVSGRYEGIDHRVCLRGRQRFSADWFELSLGKFVTLGGEAPSMTMIESIVRLIPGVIKEQESREKESYRPQQGGDLIEHPQYTRPQIVEGFEVPAVLLSGNHAEIDMRRQDNMTDSSTASQQ